MKKILFLSLLLFVFAILSSTRAESAWILWLHVDVDPKALKALQDEEKATSFQKEAQAWEIVAAYATFDECSRQHQIHQLNMRNFKKEYYPLIGEITCLPETFNPQK
jgi:hypothetical protein